MVKKTKSVSHSSSKEVEEGKACAILSYFLIGVIWYFVDEKMKKNNFAKFHAKQGLVLFIAWFVYAIVVGILSMIVAFILWFLAPVIWLLWLVPWIFFIIGIINAAQGREKEMPLIGHFAKHFTF